jgi:hypothetical protein
MANLLLLVLLWSCAAPAALAVTQADLPPCCRHHGAHHCSMMATATAKGGSSGYHANLPRCPYRLLAQVVSSAAATVAERTCACAQARSALDAQIESTDHNSSTWARNSGRSPPNLL